VNHAPRQRRQWTVGVSQAGAAGGFTLLEMMVVMMLLGLMTTLVLPSMQRWHDGVEARSQVAGLVESLRAAAFAAPTNRKRLVMDSGSFIAPPSSPKGAAEEARGQVPAAGVAPLVPAPGRISLILPRGWRAERVVEAAFLPSGLCSPGFAALRTQAGAPLVLEVLGPRCSIRVSYAEADR
jgi:prepilin-type N-terminal cleavage/methylation domain-containing protein